MEDQVRAECPDCGASGEVPAVFVGRTVRCKKCGHRFEVEPEEYGLAGGHSGAASKRKYLCTSCGHVMTVSEPDPAPRTCAQCDSPTVEPIEDDAKAPRTGGGRRG